ncbi:hypothetical protein DPMN_085438 [Dreissena polymorpha]|uniref:Uncharacterized protein n=1 Tax=Dreissena polymorpha TaxID=45954 RepID=A0A9D4BCW2_DREPO|nr:hypothetical protein DPMN_085438 [Dreissena polymorpha]
MMSSPECEEPKLLMPQSSSPGATEHQLTASPGRTEPPMMSNTECVEPQLMIPKELFQVLESFKKKRTCMDYGFNSTKERNRIYGL